MKKGNELIKNGKFKVFVYMDSEYEEGNDNAFISGVYKSDKQFKRENPGMIPFIEYDVEHLVKVLSRSIKEMKKE